MKKLVLKYRVALAGVFCFAVSVSAADNLESRQVYLDAVNSEAIRLEPYSIPLNTDSRGALQDTHQAVSIEEMVLKLKKLTAHTIH